MNNGFGQEHWQLTIFTAPCLVVTWSNPNKSHMEYASAVPGIKQHFQHVLRVPFEGVLAMEVHVMLCEFLKKYLTDLNKLLNALDFGTVWGIPHVYSCSQGDRRHMHVHR